ncbi:hypothetical protein GCM10018980_20650 [Streptomyces capoamus]|uniref:Uncharacterized protein n=1 Tax=Streptomyces capoamus TaxID=68183 RepID=A0A919C262_9ACTN|nr:hypothetical protein GCM10010501_03230 [Streptomyces libani subsp. rufus]GHG43663.1 hypothetical protein GCM10018980_20650 [Streptomyces capoamus]
MFGRGAARGAAPAAPGPCRPRIGGASPGKAVPAGTTHRVGPGSRCRPVALAVPPRGSRRRPAPCAVRAGAGDRGLSPTGPVPVSAPASVPASVPGPGRSLRAGW